MSSTSIYGDNLHGDTEAARVEDKRLTIQSLGVLHHHVHDGHSFVVSHDSGSIANGATSDLLFLTGAKQCHMNYNAGATGAFLISIFEKVTYSAEGTADTIFNRLLGSAEPSTALAYTAPTISDTGTQLPDEIIPGGNNVGGSSVGGDFDRYIFQMNTAYLFRLTNISGNISRALITLAWYEPEENYS